MKTKKHNKRYTLFIIALVLGVLLAILVASQSFTVEVDADNVVKITTIVNYNDEAGQSFPGAKMHIVVFEDEIGK